MLRTRTVVGVVGLLTASTRAHADEETYTVNSNDPDALPLHLAAGIGVHLPVQTEGVAVVPVHGAYDVAGRVRAPGRIGIPVGYLTKPKSGYFDAEVGGALYPFSSHTNARLALFSTTRLIYSGEGKNLRLRQLGPRAGLKFFRTAKNAESTDPGTYADYQWSMLIAYGGLDLVWRENFDINTSLHGNKATTRMVDWYIDVMYGVSGTTPDTPAGAMPLAAETHKVGWRVGMDLISGHPVGVSFQFELGSMPGITGDVYGLITFGAGMNIL